VQRARLLERQLPHLQSQRLHRLRCLILEFPCLIIFKMNTELIINKLNLQYVDI
jgi:hypothetical protein